MKNKRIEIRVSEDELARLDWCCERTGQSRSDIIREYINADYDCQQPIVRTNKCTDKPNKTEPSKNDTCTDKPKEASAARKPTYEEFLKGEYKGKPDFIAQAVYEGKYGGIG